LRESPESFQAGQSFSVSANQLGFGKLPAVVALNILAISLNILLNSTHFKSTIQ
jgi:fumarate reductase subunit C